MKEETEKLLRELADKLGTTIEHLYEVLTKEAKAKAIYEIVYLLCYALFGVFMWFLTSKTYYTAPAGNHDIEVSTLIMYVFYLADIISGAIILFQLPMRFSDLYSYYKNPEYSAIQEILQHL